MYKIRLSDQAKSDLKFFHKTNQKVYARIKKLLEEVVQNPFSGIGKPEPLRHNLAGHWSRRINREHRLVYRMQNDEIQVVSCRYHY